MSKAKVPAKAPPPQSLSQFSEDEVQIYTDLLAARDEGATQAAAELSAVLQDMV